MQDYEEVPIPVHDVTAICLRTEGCTKPHLIINIYNPSKEEVITPLIEYVAQHISPQHYHAIIMLGDFNLHHPLWNPPGRLTHDTGADDLIKLAASLNLSLLIPEGTVTYPSAGTAIDLTWGNAKAEQCLQKCKIAKNNDHGSDHLPIKILLDLEVRQSTNETTQYNYAKANWDEMSKLLRTNLAKVPLNPELNSPSKLDQFTASTIAATQNAIEQTTPRKKPLPFSKSWWTEELTQLRKEENRLRNRYRRKRSVVDRKKWKEANWICQKEVRVGKQKA